MPDLLNTARATRLHDVTYTTRVHDLQHSVVRSGHIGCLYRSGIGSYSVISVGICVLVQVSSGHIGCLYRSGIGSYFNNFSWYLCTGTSHRIRRWQAENKQGRRLELG